MSCGAGLWNTVEPSNSNGVEDKAEVYLNADGRVNDQTASATRYFLCEKEIVCPAGHACAGTSSMVRLPSSSLIAWA
jgi:hypothetical protein